MIRVPYINRPRAIRKVVNPRMPTIKSIPPICSHFQAMIRIKIITNTGMLCIKNATRIFQKPCSSSNTSSENIAQKRIIKIRRMRKTHVTYGLPFLVVFFVIPSFFNYDSSLLYVYFAFSISSFSGINLPHLYKLLLELLEREILSCELLTIALPILS